MKDKVLLFQSLMLVVELVVTLLSVNVLMAEQELACKKKKKTQKTVDNTCNWSTVKLVLALLAGLGKMLRSSLSAISSFFGCSLGKTGLKDILNNWSHFRSDPLQTSPEHEFHLEDPCVRKVSFCTGSGYIILQFV